MAIEDISTIVGAGSSGITTGGGGGGGGISLADVYNAYRIEFKTITLTDVTNQYVQLAASPVSSAKLSVDVMEGTNLQLGVDYNVDIINDRVGWNALQLDGLIAVGDVIRIIYFS